ncbi:hypothetical protein D3C77_467960 [compost metagenome]|nr:hypothetical protein CQ065_26380 [Pseudomonas sp. MYb187]
MRLIPELPLKGGWEAEISRSGHSGLFFISKWNHWFHTREIGAAIESCEKILDGFEKRVVMGASLGGHAAIRLSRRMKADVVLAISPQFCINPSIVGGFERRWRTEHKEIESYGEPISLDSAIDEVYIIYDDLHLVDARHVFEINRQIPCQMFSLSDSGHSSVRPMADLRLLERMFELSIEKSGNVRLLNDMKDYYDLNWMRSPKALQVHADRLPISERLGFLSGKKDLIGLERHKVELGLYIDKLEKQLG